MTEVAPASSAMRACSTFITSMMTPPLSISARPIFRRRLVPVKLLFPFGSGMFFDLDSDADSAARLRRGMRAD